MRGSNIIEKRVNEKSIEPNESKLTDASQELLKVNILKNKNTINKTAYSREKVREAASSDISLRKVFEGIRLGKFQHHPEDKSTINKTTYSREKVRKAISSDMSLRKVFEGIQQEEFKND